MNIFQDLWKRRVPHVVGVYLGISWAVIEFVGFLVDQYTLSPHLVTFSLVALVSLLPSVSIIAYFHGTPGSQGWTRAEKFAVPSNLLALGALLVVLFSGKDLGAATTTVAVTDEEGNTTERTIPKSEFRRNVLLFPFDNTAGDSSTDWIQHGIPIALGVDLEQDMFIQTRSTDALVAELRQRGYPDGLDLPLTLKRELAEEAHAPMFVAGSFAVVGGEIEVEVNLYETERSKLIAERSYASTDDIIALTDEMSVALKRDLGIPSQHIEEAQDLPLADQLTGSLDAFRHLSEAYRAVTFEQDWAAGSAAVQASLALDSTNAYAHMLHYGIALLSNDRANAQSAIDNAMQHSYKLPERTRFQVKLQYYDFRQEAEKALAVAEMRVDLFDDDIQGRLMLAQLYSLRDRVPDAMEQFEAVLAIDPSRTEYLQQLGALARAEGDFDRAAGYFQRYADEHPDEPVSFTSLASLQRLQGDFEGAKTTYERALLLEPENVDVKVSLATLERHLGRLESGLSALEEALREAPAAQDSFGVLTALGSLAEESGRASQAVMYVEQLLAVSQSFLPPIQMLSNQLGALDTYVAAGQIDRARMILGNVEQQLQSPFDQLGWLGHLAIAMALEDADAIEAAIPGVQALITGLGVQALQPAVLEGTAQALELRERCEEAIPIYQEALDLNPTATSLHLDIGRCHRKLGDLDEAEERIRQGLATSPFAPEMHYELALVLADRGDTAEAVQHLETALAVWENADPGYPLAQKAQEELARLGG